MVRETKKEAWILSRLSKVKNIWVHKSKSPILQPSTFPTLPRTSQRSKSDLKLKTKWLISIWNWAKVLKRYWMISSRETQFSCSQKALLQYVTKSRRSFLKLALMFQTSYLIMLQEKRWEKRCTMSFRREQGEGLSQVSLLAAHILAATTSSW